ncbi:MAG: hypothetical protein B7Z80_15530 [Rhodospirillales bacterium 20-64-7]|nr:MAG: hypothetical protein B7Z80_15530 [Rhodospirillales bacterium 20-64-7]
MSSERLHNIAGRYDPLKTEPTHGIGNARDDRPETKHPAYAKTAEQVPSEKRVSPAVAEIHATWGQSPDPAAFAAAMRDQGYRLARVTPEESRDSHRAHASAKELGTIAPRYRDGEIVVVNDRGWTYRLNERSTGANRADIQKFAAEMKAADLPSLTEAKKAQLAERQKQDVVFKETAWHRRGISTMEIKILGLQEAAERGGAPVAAGLHAEGLTLARVDAAGKAHVERDNQQRYENDRLLGKADARLRQAPNEGELVVVNKRGMVFRLNPTFVETDRLERAAMTGNVQTPALSAAMRHFATERQRQKDDRHGARDARQTFWKEERADARLGDAIKRAPGIAVGNIKNVGFKVVDTAGKFMSLSSFVESLFGMGKAQSAPDEHTKLPPGPASDPEQAWEEIYQAVQQGRALPADAVRHLPPSDLENLRRHGDAHINDKILDMEREKERDETRGWEDHLGRELER